MLIRCYTKGIIKVFISHCVNCRLRICGILKLEFCLKYTVLQLEMNIYWSFWMSVDGNDFKSILTYHWNVRRNLRFDVQNKNTQKIIWDHDQKRIASLHDMLISWCILVGWLWQHAYHNGMHRIVFVYSMVQHIYFRCQGCLHTYI